MVRFGVCFCVPSHWGSHGRRGGLDGPGKGPVAEAEHFQCPIWGRRLSGLGGLELGDVRPSRRGVGSSTEN